MKKTLSVLSCMLFALITVVPFGALLSAYFGYTLRLISIRLISIPAFSIIIAFISVCTVVFSVIFKSGTENKTVGILLSVLLPLSFINAAFYLIECSRICVAVSVFISLGCVCFLTAKHGKPLFLKISALVLSALMILPFSFFCIVVLIFGNIGQNTVVKSVKSPNGVYYAEVIDSDQGALGGDTLVDVYENNGINALIFKISKKPQRVYHGKWGEFKSMDIYWKDDDCLVINSVEYEINSFP